MKNLDDFGLKIGVYSHFNKYMKIYEFKRSRSFFDLSTQGWHNLTFHDICSKVTGQIVTILHIESPGAQGMKI